MTETGKLTQTAIHFSTFFSNELMWLNHVMGKEFASNFSLKTSSWWAQTKPAKTQCFFVERRIDGWTKFTIRKRTTVLFRRIFFPQKPLRSRSWDTPCRINTWNCGESTKSITARFFPNQEIFLRKIFGMEFIHTESFQVFMHEGVYIGLTG